jgi:hypothetical protein
MWTKARRPSARSCQSIGHHQIYRNVILADPRPDHAARVALNEASLAQDMLKERA